MSSSDRPHLKERPSMRATLWLASLSLLALGACATDPSHDRKAAADPPPVTPSERSGIQADALHDFIGRWMQTDRAPITIKAPEHGPAQAAVYRTATGARDFLIGQG